MRRGFDVEENKTWIGECVKRPVTDLDPDTDLVGIAHKDRAFLNEVLAGWRRHLVVLADAEFAPTTYKSRWGEAYNIEQMLEHAVVGRLLDERLDARGPERPRAVAARHRQEVPLQCGHERRGVVGVQA